MKLVLLFIRQFAFGLSIGCLLAGNAVLGGLFLFTAFALWSLT